MLGGEVLDGVDTDVQMQAAEGQDSQEMAMRTADKLLKELRPKPGQFNILI
jgi:tetratricopeptide repeat protein 21B